jgi:murein DD-endopeptidase MepM/ murein hydrolase activator NlpD
MMRPLLLCVAALLLFAAPAAGGDIYHQKRAIDERISTLHSRIVTAHARESTLTAQISIANAKINALAADVAQAQNQLATLEAQLAASQHALDQTTALYTQETQNLKLLKRQYAIALARLDRRLLQAYETPDPDAVDVLLSTTTLNDLLSNVEYLQQIGRQDSHISTNLRTARNKLRVTRERTRQARTRIATETAQIRERTEQQRTVAAQLASSQQELTSARGSQQAALSSVKAADREYVRESQLLAAQSASIAARIRAAEAAAAARAATPSPPSSSAAPPPSSSPSSSTPSSSGLIWPVQGPVTSPFGPRCLPNGDCSFHPGIDIGAASGTPIHAAAAGTVIYAGWMDGYGNLTVIDHGHGLATAYGHQSSIAAGLGSTVSQGTVIGYVGCTGYCLGPHLHFEVRVNGEPVDPMGYL